MSKEDFEYFNERMMAHTTSVRGDADPSAIPDGIAMRSIASFAKRGAYPGIRSNDADILASVDRVAVEEAAARPIWQKICQHLSGDEPDLIWVASEMSRAEAAAENASERAYRQAVSRMSQTSRQLIEREIQERKASIVRSQVDYISLAADAPKVFQEFVERFCERLRQEQLPRELPNMEVKSGDSKARRDFGG